MNLDNLDEYMPDVIHYVVLISGLTIWNLNDRLDQYTLIIVVFLYILLLIGVYAIPLIQKRYNQWVEDKSRKEEDDYIHKYGETILDKLRLQSFNRFLSTVVVVLDDDVVVSVAEIKRRRINSVLADKLFLGDFGHMTIRMGTRCVHKFVIDRLVLLYHTQQEQLGRILLVNCLKTEKHNDSNKRENIYEIIGIFLIKLLEPCIRDIDELRGLIESGGGGQKS